MSDYRYVVLTQSENRHYVCTFRSGVGWFQIIAKFAAKDRADAYADIENMFLDEEMPANFDDLHEEAPNLTEPQSGFSRHVVASLAPPDPPDDEPGEDQPHAADEEQQATVEPDEPEPENEEPPPQDDEPEPATENDEPSKPDVGLIEKIRSALDRTFDDYPNGIDVSDLCGLFAANGKEIRAAVDQLAINGFLVIKHRKPSGKVYVAPPLPKAPKTPVASKSEKEPVLSTEGEERQEKESSDPVFAGLSTNQTAVLRTLRANANDAGEVDLPLAKIAKLSGTARGSINYNIDALETKSKIKRNGGVITIPGAGKKKPPKREPGPVPMADTCDCEDGRLDREETVGSYVIRYWICRCPKERKWTTRHDIKELT